MIHYPFESECNLDSIGIDIPDHTDPKEQWYGEPPWNDADRIPP